MPKSYVGYRGRFKYLHESTEVCSQTIPQDDFTPLLLAVEQGYLDIVKYLIKENCNIEARTKDDFTPLLLAVQQGYLEIVKYLIKANCNIEARTKDGFTPLLYAVQQGYIYITSSLQSVSLYSDVLDLEEDDDDTFMLKLGLTPLLVAAYNGHLTLVQYLITVGCVKETRSYVMKDIVFKDGETVLHCAAEGGHFQVTKWLIEEGGDQSPVCDTSDCHVKRKAKRKPQNPQQKGLLKVPKGTILNATVQSLLRSKEVTATVGAVKSVDDKEDLDTVKQSEETKNQDVVTSIPDAGEVTHSGNMSKPGALKSQDNIPRAVKKKSKLQPFLDLRNRIQKAFKGRTPSHIVTQNDRGGKMEETKIEENLTGIDMSEEEIIKLVRSQCTLGQYEMVVVPIDLWDFGGQKIYHLTHQLFVTSRGTFLLIFNGSRDIHENISEYTELPGCQGQRNTAVYLIHWVNSVLTYCKTFVENKEYPKILCVATHKDLVKGDVEEQRTSLENSIEELFQNHGGKNHLQYKPLIFVNARNKEDEELATLKKQLVDVALDHPRCGELMPTKFVPLELQLARKVEKNKKILTMDELNDINKQNDKMALTPAQLKSFLKVNHALGKLIYFDEACLRDNVIIDPVFLVDVLRSIVTDDQFWPEHLKEILKSLKESGKLLKRDLYEIWKQDCFREIWAHNDYIVDMLVHLDIICRQKDDEDGSDFFLVPCMISNKREESQQIDHDRSIHLAYRFKEEVVPPAILYRFIATFISIWKLRVSAKSSRLMIFTDSADVKIDGDHDMRFDIQGNRFIVSLIHKDNKSSIIPTIASTAQECLTHAITNISNFYFSVSGDSACNRDLPFTIQIGIPCGTDLCFFDHTLSSKEWICPEHKTKHKTK
ncbi:unnamed protein product [Mytilus edulis]|uniref:COR domain-containing protein n=1 Tax=Mytilus edulis TaxID=6550 RepID=A0A8S3RPB9_MYTED|nr:unnamed protein product [Mytilus edulis]